MQEDIKKATEVLKAGGIIIYPGDTIWSLGCDATNPKAIEKIFRIKSGGKKRKMIILASDEAMVGNYVKKIPDISGEIIKTYKGPISIVYDNARNLPKNIINEDGSIAIRVPESEFCLELIRSLGKPVVSTAAAPSTVEDPETFNKIIGPIKDAADYICTTNRYFVNTPKPSTIIKIEADESITVIRG
jgi:L-threonylcarbamoyladenylate synthase